MRNSNDKIVNIGLIDGTDEALSENNTNKADDNVVEAGNVYVTVIDDINTLIGEIIDDSKHEKQSNDHIDTVDQEPELHGDAVVENLRTAVVETGDELPESAATPLECNLCEENPEDEIQEMGNERNDGMDVFGRNNDNGHKDNVKDD